MTESIDSQVMDGRRYREVREQLGLSLQGLANILGLTRQGVYHRETGRRRITAEHWLALEAVMIRVQQTKADRLRTLPRHKVLGLGG